MRAETKGLFDGALGKIVRGVVARDRDTIVGKFRVAELIDLPRCATAAKAAAERDDCGAVGSLEQRGAVCGNRPRRPLARLVGGGFAAGVSNRNRRAAGDVFR